jgi:myosin heavy subunit
MMETIKIRQLGYPMRLEFEAFYKRYGCSHALTSHTCLHTRAGDSSCEYNAALQRRTRYKCIQSASVKGTDYRTPCGVVIDAAKKTGVVVAAELQLGKSKIFMRDAQVRARCAS